MINCPFLSYHPYYLACLSPEIIVLALLNEMHHSIDTSHLTYFFTVDLGPLYIPLVKLTEQIHRTQLTAHCIIAFFGRLLGSQSASNFLDRIESDDF